MASGGRRPQIAASKIKYQEVKGQASKIEVILLQGSNTAAGSNTTAGKWNPGSLTAGEVKPCWVIYTSVV